MKIVLEIVVCNSLLSPISCIRAHVCNSLSTSSSKIFRDGPFCDIEDQVSICIDENKSPALESDDDSFYSSVFEEFGVFKSNGLTGIEDGYEMIKGCIAQGMGKDVNNVPFLSPVRIEPHISEMILKHTKEIWIDNLCNLIFSRRFYTCLHHIAPVFVHGKRYIIPCQFLQHTYCNK